MGRCGGGECFLTVTILFHECKIQTLHISSVILVYVDILHIVNIVKLRCVPPTHKKCTLATQNASSPTVFELHIRLKQTSFCRELNCLDRHFRSFCVFDFFPVKKTLGKRKKPLHLKKYIYFSKFYY